MKKYECFNLVFSSSSTVYGKAERYPITEDHPIGNVASVYGRTKYITETMLMDLSSADDVIESHIKSISLFVIVKDLFVFFLHTALEHLFIAIL